MLYGLSDRAKYYSFCDILPQWIYIRLVSTLDTARLYVFSSSALSTGFFCGAVCKIAFQDFFCEAAYSIGKSESQMQNCEKRIKIAKDGVDMYNII